MKKSKEALDNYFDAEYEARDQTKLIDKCFEDDDIEEFVDAYQNRGLLYVEAELLNAEVTMTVPGTTGSGPVPVKPIEWILGGGTTEIGGAVNK